MAIKKIREISRDSLNLASPRNEVLKKYPVDNMPS